MLHRVFIKEDLHRDMKTKRRPGPDAFTADSLQKLQNLKGHRPQAIGLIKTFLYFAVFKHPLTKAEALHYCQYPTDSIDRELHYLVENKLLYKIKEYYLPSNEPQWVERRIKGNKLAVKKMKMAKRMATILNYFPFVRSIMISGSLSKGYMDDQSDIDFFVIMKPGNMASSKIMMGSFRRLFAPKSFCINFIIDTDHLDIKNRTIYSAIEMATLVPMVNFDLYNHFMKTNLDWVQHYLPNYTFTERQSTQVKNPAIRVFGEFLLSLKWASHLNNIVTRFYERFHKSRNPDFDKSIETGELVIAKGVLKFHNGSYEQRILNLYQSYQESFILNKEFTVNEHFGK